MLNVMIPRSAVRTLKAKEITVQFQQVMSQPVLTCRLTDSLSTAAQLMWEYDCGSIPVTDDEGRLVGIVTDRDICMAAYTTGATLHALPVTHAMAREVFFCHATEPLDLAERLMTEKQIRRVPVVDSERRPIGLVSMSDVARYSDSTRRRTSIDREVTHVLAGISQPRSRAIEASP